MKQRIEELPYFADSGVLFAQIAHWRWAVFLDSGPAEARQGRYDILAAEPCTTLVTRGASTEVCRGDCCESSTDDPFALLRRELGPVEDTAGALPFQGGALGYFSYDLGRRLERLPEQSRDDRQLPEMAVGIYDWALVVDHRERRSWLVSAGRSAATTRRWDKLLALFSAPLVDGRPRVFRTHGAVGSSLPFSRYEAGFRRIQQYIRDGDCYQVNFAQRFSVACDGDAWLAYRALRESNSAPFSAWMHLPFLQVLCASPERFLQVRNRQIMTQPIKGTARRSDDPVEDAARARALRQSEKDRAENVMIVDLLRNDLSKNSEYFSVAVPKLFELQRFATVHHLVSTVTATLRQGRDALDLLRGCFPGGSITGAPKIRAMEIIDELEGVRRGIYCGCIGYVGFNGDMDTNIVIRTLTVQDGRIDFWAGGGIVIDSRLEAEYQETLDKAHALHALIGRFREATYN
jgi:para-aminobenzoate synthetase component 1